MKSGYIIILFSLLTVFFFSGCNRNGGKSGEMLSTDVVNNPNTASGVTDSKSLPAFRFEKIEHDFGKIIEGETVSYSFKFINVGKSDLLITDVSTSCGCTVPSYPKTPIRVGEEGIIKIAFNSRGKRGFQSKNVLVVANTQPNTTMLRVKTQVVSPGAEK